MTPSLPPGPRLPRAVQLIGWWSRPRAFLEQCRDRYGKRFTIRLPATPPFVMLADPDDVKQVFTASPEVLHPGEGARILEPVVGRNSVILLDEGTHLSQRKLMLPAFHGEKMQRLAGLMQEVAEREVASWPRGEPVVLHGALPGADARGDPARGVRPRPGPPAWTRCASTSRACPRSASSPASMLPVLQRELGGRSPWARFVRRRDEADRLIFELIDERRDDARRPRRRARDAARRTPRGRLADVRPGAARRADDAAGGRPRDHGHGAGLVRSSGWRASPEVVAAPRPRRSRRTTATPT